MHRILVLGVVALSALAGACGPTASSAKPVPVVASVPFADGERLTYSIRGDLGASGGKGTLSVRKDGANLRLEQRYEEATPPAGATPNADTTTVIAGAADLRPSSMLRELSGR